MLVYILEDDENIRELESYALTKEGFTVRDFEVPRCFMWVEHNSVLRQEGKSWL